VPGIRRSLEPTGGRHAGDSDDADLAPIDRADREREVARLGTGGGACDREEGDYGEQLLEGKAHICTSDRAGNRGRVPGSARWPTDHGVTEGHGEGTEPLEPDRRM
jgi:hypothetical protein